MLRTSFILLLIVISITAYGQQRKKKKQRSAPVEQAQQPTALNPSEKEYTPKTSKRSKSSGPTFDAERNFYERMEALEKTKRKNEKLKEKPQYSDPMYFGHKRPPKKRKPSKMRYCKECGIRH